MLNSSNGLKLMKLENFSLIFDNLSYLPVCYLDFCKIYAVNINLKLPWTSAACDGGKFNEQESDF